MGPNCNLKSILSSELEESASPIKVQLGSDKDGITESSLNDQSAAASSKPKGSGNEKGNMDRF